MSNYKFKHRYLEHGMFFKDSGGVSDFQTLAYTRDMPDSKQLLSFFYNKPVNSSFYKNSDNVSFALIQSEFGFIFTQIQRRQEFRGKTRTGSGLFDQTRFTLLSEIEIRNAFLHGSDLFDALIINENGEFFLEIYKSAYGEIMVPDVNCSPPSIQYANLLKDSKIFDAISMVCDALLSEDQILVICKKGEYTLLDRLVIVQEAERLLLPILNRPFTFALDSLFHPKTKIGIRFQTDDEPNNTKAFVVNLGRKSKNTYVSGVADFLYKNTFSSGIWSEETWLNANKRLYQDQAAFHLAQNGKSQMAASWLSEIVFTEKDIVSYYKAIINYQPELGDSVYKVYFDRHYHKAISINENLVKILSSNECAYSFLSKVRDYHYSEEDFTLKEWAGTVFYASLSKDEKQELLNDHNGEFVSLDDASELIRWGGGDSEKIRYGSENILYEFLKKRLLADSDSATLVLNNINWLVEVNVDDEIKYWCGFLEMPQSKRSIWSWVKSNFSDYRDAIFVALLLSDLDVGNIDIGRYHKDDIERVVSLRNDPTLNRRPGFSQLIDALEKKTDGMHKEDVRRQAVLTNKYDDYSIEPEWIDIPKDKFKNLVPEQLQNEKESGSLLVEDNIVDEKYDGTEQRTDRISQLVSLELTVKRIVALAIFAGLVFLGVKFGDWLSIVNSFNPPSNTSTPFRETKTPLPSSTILPDGIMVEEWGSNRGDLYLTYHSSHGLYLLGSVTDNEAVPVGLDNCVNTVTQNNRGNMIYTACAGDVNETSVGFVNDNADAEIIATAPFLLADPSIYPGNNTVYDLLFVCNRQAVCAFSRPPEDSPRGKIDELVNIIVEDYTTYTAAWIDTDYIIISMYNSFSNHTRLILYNTQTKDVSDIIEASIELDFHQAIIDIERWNNSNPDTVYFAFIGKRDDSYQIYIIRIEKNGPNSFTYFVSQKYSIPKEISNVNQLVWDPQRNSVAFVGDIARESLACNIKCLFVFDLATNNTILINTHGDIKSIFWDSNAEGKPRPKYLE